MAFAFGVFTTIAVGGGLGYTINILTNSVWIGVYVGITILLLPFAIFGIMSSKRLLRNEK